MAILRSLVPHAAKVALARALTHPALGAALLRRSGGEVRSDGLRFRIRDPRAAIALKLGLYERSESDLIRAYLPRDFDVIELGGSSGILTAKIANRIDPSRRVISVEANPALVCDLNENLILNAIENVVVVNAAVMYGGGPRVVFNTADGSLSGRVEAAEEVLSSDGNNIEVPAITLADLVARFEIGRYVLVADIEGGEVSLFRHEATALDNCELVLIELDGGVTAEGFYSPNDVEELILSRGFARVYRDGNCAAFRRTDVFSV